MPGDRSRLYAVGDVVVADPQARHALANRVSLRLFRPGEVYFEIPKNGEEAQQAARALSNVMFAEASELPKRWIDDAELKLCVEWSSSASPKASATHSCEHA
jgi:hypothetical protein